MAFLQCILFLGIVVIAAWADDELALVPMIPESRRLGSCGLPQYPIPNTCREQLPRDLMFIVDASNTINHARFYGEMLDFLQEIYCALNVEQLNRGSLITFGSDVAVRIPLQQYSPEQWFERVEEVRSNRNICCHCCTPLAEALLLARQVFTKNPSQSDIIPVRIVVVITDGAVWQNTGKKKGFWTWPNKASHTKYKYQIVPNEAYRLKNMDPNHPLRLMVLGVPRGNGTAFSEMDYFTGAGIGKSTIRCETRTKQRDCVIASTPPFPIVSMPLSKNVFTAQNWNISRMVQDTIPDLCEVASTRAPVVTKTPTGIPSRAPSRGPTVPTLATLKPTASPTQNELFGGLDIFLFVDRSRSMIWRADTCRRAPGGNVNADDAHVCWELFLRFGKSLVSEATELGFQGHSNFKWQDDWTNKTRGVRAWIYGFACADDQTKPIVERIGEKISNQADFDAAIERAKLLTPNGGTCPNAALERSLGMILANDLLDRPKMAFMLTDGVFYQGNKAQMASRGFAQLGVLTYALGIAIADNGKNYGLSPREISTQKSQLLAFVNGERDRLKNLGEEGLFLLDDIAQEIIERLPADFAKNYPRVLKNPYWCGFSSAERCLNTHPEVFDTSIFCKWIPTNPKNFNGRGSCLDKKWCKWKKEALCRADTYCKFSGGQCLPNAKALNQTSTAP